MSASDSKRYQPVSVEDWDDDAQAPLPGTRTTTANVAVKRDSFELDYPSSVNPNYDGTDSGYGSKAPTVSSMASSSRRRTSDLKIDTINLLERERKPYLVSAVRPNLDRQSSSRPKEKDTKDAKDVKAVKKPFCHEKGQCWVCDKYGYHFDPKKDVPKPTPTQISASQPSSQQIQQTRAIVQRTKTDDVVRPPAHRMSTIQSRPTSMYVATPIHAPFPQYAPNAWHATSTPVVAYSPYYVTPPTPMTPLVHGYPHPQQYFYEPTPMYEGKPAPPQTKIVRRMSTANYEQPIIDKKSTRTTSVPERPVSQDKRPQITSQLSHKALKGIDADRIAMPPPPKPSHASVAVGRPRPGRSQTYHSNSTVNRRSHYEVEEEEDEVFTDDDEVEEHISHGPHAAHREPPSPSRPPSSYRRQAIQEVSDRPQLREKAQSYQDGSHVARPVSGSRQDYMPRRRTTESVPIDRREAEAEAYIRKRGSMPVVDLTAENLKVLKNHNTRNIPDQRSESGSTVSHATHQSSSKDSSSGRGRAVSAMAHAQKTSMNIHYNGMSLNITDGGGFDRDNGPPVKIDIGAIQLSMNNRDKENVDYRKQQKQLESGPSMSSNPSRRSLTGSSIVSNSSQKRDRDDILAIEPPVRRTSYVEDEEDEAERNRELLEQIRRTSAKSSRQPSRETSNVRAAEARPARREPLSNRSSVDYSGRRDEPAH